MPHLDPADAPLPRERAKAPYTPAEISGYLALADAQPTAARRMRAAALVCLSAGAGLIRSDLRNVRGTDIGRRCGGVIVTVRGGRAPRAVPALARYHARLLAAAESAGTALLLTGGTGPARRDISHPLTRRWPAGPGCRRWTPAGCAPPGFASWRTAARPAQRSCTPRDRLLQRLGGIIASLDPGSEEQAVALLGASMR